MHCTLLPLLSRVELPCRSEERWLRGKEIIYIKGDENTNNVISDSINEYDKQIVIDACDKAIRWICYIVVKSSFGTFRRVNFL